VAGPGEDAGQLIDGIGGSEREAEANDPGRLLDTAANSRPSAASVAVIATISPRRS